MKQQITSFKVLFPHLKSGGIYVIEDLHTSYWKLYGGSGSHPRQWGDIGNPITNKSTAITFLQNLVHNINFYGAKIGRANYENCPDKIKSSLNFYQKTIESIHFYCSLCFIIKR